MKADEIRKRYPLTIKRLIALDGSPSTKTRIEQHQRTFDILTDHIVTHYGGKPQPTRDAIHQAINDQLAADLPAKEARRAERRGEETT